MTFDWLNQGDYKNLKYYEGIVIHRYFDDYALVNVEEILRSGEDISQGMRDFIADILIKKVGRPPGKRSSTKERDGEIHLKVSFLLYRGYKLTSNAKSNGAAAIAGELFGIEEDAALKAYQKTERDWNGRGEVGVDVISQLFKDDKEDAEMTERWIDIRARNKRKNLA